LQTLDGHLHFLTDKQYAQIVPEQFGAYYYGRWWKLRANAPDLSATELQSFYILAARWGNKEDFEDWSKRHAAEGVRDYRQWAALWHTWGEDDRAWKLLSIKVGEPSFPNMSTTIPREVLENAYRLKPENVVNAQQLAMVLRHDGKQAESDEIIITVANGENPPPWFVDKAAWVLAAAGRPGEAVDLLLRPR